MKPSRLAQLLVFVGLSVFTVPRALAQNDPAQPDQSPTPAQAQPSPSPSASPKVLRVLGNVELDDVVEVQIENLQDWAEKNDVNKLVPYIDGRAIRGNYPEELHIQRGRLIFHLESTPENKSTWIDLLGEPNSLRKPVTLSVVLDLMGISAGTALGEAMIDSGKDRANTNQIQSLTAEKQALEQSITETQPQLDAANEAASTAITDQSNRDALNRQLTDNRTRLGHVDQQLRTLSDQQPNMVSNGFLRDVLSDSSGYSFHRFQIFAWTIVLGIIFMSSVYNSLTMPDVAGVDGIERGHVHRIQVPRAEMI